MDASSTMAADHDLPLLICAREEDRQVNWSPSVASELARVSTRETAIDAVRRGYLTTQIREPLEAVRQVIDQVVTSEPSRHLSTSAVAHW